MSAILEGIKNFWTGYSKDNERYYEKRLIAEWGEIPLASVKIEEIKISSEADDTIHCISITTGSKIPYVFLPGYGSSGAMYYKMMKTLASRFDLYHVDIRGMGGSGRPEFTAKSQKETDDYLIQGLEIWRQKMGIEKMILAGHSLGGYVAVKYAAVFPSKVISLVLISPAAIWPTPPNIQEITSSFINKLGFIQRNLFKKVADYWVPGKSPLQLLRKFGRAASIGLNKYVKMFKQLKDDERSDLKEYLFQILMKPGTGEIAMGYILERGGYGVDGLEKYLYEFKLPISIFFGDRDWMTHSKPKDFGTNLYYLKNPWIKEKIIKGAGHHICFDNSKDLLDSILSNLTGIIK